MKKITLLLIVVALLTSCSHKNARRSYSYASNAPASYGYNYKGLISEQSEPGKMQDERMMAYDAIVDLTVKEPDTTIVQIRKMVDEKNGYIVSISPSRAVFRVKATMLNSCLEQIALFGKVTDKTIIGSDVTDQYQDLEIRLENAMKARSRYLELLEKAENVQAALMVEKELERLNTEIDILTGKIKRLEHIVEYSSITVNIEKKVKPGIVGYVFVGLYKSVKWLFVRN